MANTGDTLTLETTKGPVVIEMNPALAPGHVAHIKRLVSEGFYEIDPANREDYLTILRDLQASRCWPARVIHAWWPKANGGAAYPAAISTPRAASSTW